MKSYSKQALLKLAEKHENISIDHMSVLKTKSLITPVLNISSDAKDNIYAGYSKVYQIKDTKENETNIFSITVFKRDQYEYTLECNNAFLIGSLSTSVKNKCLNKLAKELRIPKNKISKNFGIFSKNGFCEKNINGGTCAHEIHIFSLFSIDNLKDELDNLVENYENLTKKQSDNSPLAPAIRQVKCFQQGLYSKPCLFIGQAGGGKTHFMRKIGQQVKKKYNKGYFFEIACFNGMDEHDLLGYTKKTNINGTDKNIFFDGKLTRAIRKAVNNKVVINIDEIARLTPKARTVLMTFLSPTLNNTYRLETDNIIGYDEDGDQIIEVLEAPVGNLFIGCTTNVGIQYDAIHNMGEAFMDRFIVIPIETTKKKLTSILTKVVKSKEYSQNLVKNLVRIYSEMEKAILPGMTKGLKTPSLRCMCYCVNSAINEEDVIVLLKEHVYNWIERDLYGKPNEAQRTLIIDIIDGVLT